MLLIISSYTLNHDLVFSCMPTHSLTTIIFILQHLPCALAGTLPPNIRYHKTSQVHYCASQKYIQQLLIMFH